MNKTIKVVGTLLVICLVAALALGYTNSITAPIIAERNVQADNALRKDVLPEAKDFEKVESSEFDAQGGMIQEVYKGLDGSEVVGYTIKTAPSGYGGTFDCMVGISKDGKITGVNMSNMQETAGLGAKAVEPEFRGQYKGKEAKELVVAKGSAKGDNEILAISGATITSTAVTNGVNSAIKLFDTLK